MAWFVVAVAPDSLAVVFCPSSASGRVLVRNWQLSLCCFVLDVLLMMLIADWSSLLFFWHTSTSQLLNMQAVVTGVVLPFPPSVIAFICFWRIGFSTHWSSIFHQVLLTHAIALSASQLVHKMTNYTSTHSEEFEHTKSAYTRLEDVTWYAIGAVSEKEPFAPVV